MQFGSGEIVTPLHSAAARPAITERAGELIVAATLAYPLLIYPLFIESPAANASLAAGAASVHSTVANQLYFPVLLLIATGAALAAPLDRLRLLGRGPLLLLGIILLLGLVSISWSLDPVLAAKRLVLQLCVSGVLVLSVLLARDVESVFKAWLVVAALATAANLGALVTTAPGPLGHDGIYSQKNVLGAVAALFVFLGIYGTLLREWRWRLLGAAVATVALILLVMSRSKTSLGLAVVIPPAAFLLLWLSRALRLSAAVVLIGGLVTMTVVYAIGEALFLWDFELISTVLFGDPTFTLRTHIWDFGWGKAAERPWTGYGFQTFWSIGPEGPVPREAPGFVASMPNGHSGYLDVVLQLGVPGLIAVLAMVIATIHAAARRGLPPARAWLFVAVVLYCLAHNALETDWLDGFNAVWLAFVVVAAAAARSAPDDGREPPHRFEAARRNLFTEL